MFKAREPQRANCQELKDEEKTIISTWSRTDTSLAEKNIFLVIKDFLQFALSNIKLSHFT